MVRSRLPVPSLLGLFGALLILSPELPGYLQDKPSTDKKVQKALEVAVEQYNKDRSDSANYFKMLRFLKAQYQVNVWEEHHLLVELVETTCKKKAGFVIKFTNIQKCQLLPGKQEKPICYFKVVYSMFPLVPRKLVITFCG